MFDKGATAIEIVDKDRNSWYIFKNQGEWSDSDIDEFFCSGTQMRDFIRDFNVFNKSLGWIYKGNNPLKSGNNRVKQALQEFAVSKGYDDVIDLYQIEYQS
jgi:hypothetical protein